MIGVNDRLINVDYLLNIVLIDAKARFGKFRTVFSPGASKHESTFQLSYFS